MRRTIEKRTVEIVYIKKIYRKKEMQLMKNCKEILFIIAMRKGSTEFMEQRAGQPERKGLIWEDLYVIEGNSIQ